MRNVSRGADLPALEFDPIAGLEVQEDAGMLSDTHRLLMLESAGLTESVLALRQANISDRDALQLLQMVRNARLFLGGGR